MASIETVVPDEAKLEPGLRVCVQVAEPERPFALRVW
jgi:hypothetical protein